MDCEEKFVAPDPTSLWREASSGAIGSYADWTSGIAGDLMPRDEGGLELLRGILDIDPVNVDFIS